MRNLWGRLRTVLNLCWDEEVLGLREAERVYIDYNRRKMTKYRRSKV